MKILHFCIFSLIVTTFTFSYSYDDSIYFLTHSNSNSKSTGKSFKSLFLKTIDSIKIEYEYISTGNFPIENKISENYFHTKTTVIIPQDDKLFWNDLIESGRIMKNDQLCFLLFTKAYQKSLESYFDKIIQLTLPKDINSCGYKSLNSKNTKDSIDSKIR